MKYQKKVRCSLSGSGKNGRNKAFDSRERSVGKFARRSIVFSLIMTIFLTGRGLTDLTGLTGLTDMTGPSCSNGPAASAVQALAAVPAVSTEAAVRRNGRASFADKADPVLQKAERKAASGKSIWDKIKEKLPDIDLPDIKLPEISFSEFDGKAEKEKLREAVREMDEIGISPEKLVQRAWKFLNRKDNQEKIKKTSEDVRDRVQNAAEETGKNEAVKKVSEEAGKTADKVREEAGEAAEKAAKEIADRAAEKAAEEAGKAAQKTAEEAGKAARKAIEGAGKAVGQEK